MLCAYLALRAVGAIVFFLGEANLPIINTINLAAGALLYLAWAFVIRPIAPEPPPRPGPRAEEIEARVAEMLATLRATVGR